MHRRLRAAPIVLLLCTLLVGCSKRNAPPPTTQPVQTQPPDSGRTALHLAALDGNLPEVEKLVGGGADMDLKDAKGDPPLHLALENGHREVALRLLGLGAKPSILNSRHESPLEVAVVSGDEEIAAKVIKCCEERGTDVVKDRYVLLDGAGAGDVEALRLALDLGWQVDVHDSGGSTSLWRAGMGGHLAAMRLLLERGADPNFRGAAHGECMAPDVAHAGQLDALELLVAHGIDQENRDGALTAAAFEGDLEMVQWLVTEAGAVSHGALPAAANVGSTDVLVWLLDHGGPVDDSDREGQTALHLAGERGLVKTATLLLDRGADISAEDNREQTPLYHAVWWSKVELVKLLLDRGADPLHTDSNGLTIAQRTEWHHGAQDGLRALKEHAGVD